MGASRRLNSTVSNDQRRSVSQFRARLARFLDLFFPNSGLNVYAGELEVRPPDAPTTQACILGWSRWNLRRYRARTWIADTCLRLVSEFAEQGA
jgi:hypothetical protein